MTIRTPLPPPGYKPHEVATMFRVDIATIKRWRRAGKLTDYYQTPGRQYRYPREYIDALLASRAGRS